MVFDGYWLIFMIYGDILSCCAIFYAKNIMYFYL